ncbi:MAG: hypothetical protein HYU97_08710 [Deltaproteobacteria bacterium]|nr:hypothetical protein [Deltaproteobacteria bacterium]
MLTIDFPKEIGDSRIDSYLFILESFLTTKQVCLRFSTKTKISPAGFAILACLFDKACELGIRIDWNIPQSLKRQCPYLQQLSEIKWVKQFMPSVQSYDYEDKHQLLSVGETAFNFGFIERCIEKFPSGEDLQFDCKLILQELMQNTISHAGGERYYAYAGLWNKEIHLGILDMGVGIPTKLQQKYICTDDLEYILLAMKEGITTRRRRVGGLGLTHFKDVLKNNAGKLTIISGRAQVRYYFQTRKSQKSFLKYRLPGTWCCARIPL